MAKRNKSSAKIARRASRKSFVQPTMEELGLYDQPRNRIPDPEFGSYEKYLSAYADEVWVYACVARRSADVAATPINLVSVSDGKKIEQHPLLDLLNNPNPRMSLTRRMFINWLEASLLLSGNCYYLMDEIVRGTPTMLWPLMPNLVEVVPSKDPKVFREGYLYHVGGQRIPYGVEVLKQAQLFNPLSYHYGLPPLAAARMSSDTHRASSRYNLKFFDNGARPDLVFTTPHSLTPDQRNRMAAIWMKRHRGEDKAHLPTFLEKGTTAELLGMSQKDADFINQKKMSREEMCSAFQTPPALVGLFEYANYANAEEQEKIYQRGTVVPDARHLCEFLNHSLLPLFDRSGKIELRVDESAIRALQEDEDKRSQYIERYWKMGVPFNQLVKAYKLPCGEVAGVGDRSFVAGVQDAQAVPTEVQAPPQILPPGDPIADAPEGDKPKPEDKPKPKRAPSASEMREKHQRMLALADNLGSPLRVAIRKVFDDQRDLVLRAVHASGKLPSKDDINLATNKQKEALAEAMAPHVKVGVYAGRDAEMRVVRDLAKALDTDMPRLARKGQARIDKWVAGKVFAWAEDMNLTTMKRLDASIDKALAEGMSVDELAAMLAEDFDMERDYRTLRAAQTEMIAALNEGALEAYRDNPFVEKKGWLATEDEVTRDDHRAAGEKYDEDGAISVDANFIVGGAAGAAPGQTGDPAQDINCRCSIFPVTIPKES